jgi:hypothetical protein
MRKIFGGAMLFSALGAVILGGALAWNASETTGLETIEVNSIEFDMIYIQAPNAILGPNDGVHRHIGRLWIDNDGTSNITFNTGAVEIVDVQVDDNGVPDDMGVCAVSNFGGSLDPALALEANGVIAPDNPSNPANDPPHLNVLGAVANGAPDACQGATVTYRVVVVMTTAAPDPPPGP